MSVCDCDSCDEREAGVVTVSDSLLSQLEEEDVGGPVYSWVEGEDH